MSRQILRPVKVWTDAKGQPTRFVWRDVTYWGQVRSMWKLSDKWWDGLVRHHDRPSVALPHLLRAGQDQTVGDDARDRR